VRHFLLAGVAPVAGGLMLLGLFGYDVYKLNNANPNSAVSSSKMWFGVGSSDVLGVGLILLGFVFLAWWWRKSPGFFRRRPETYEPPPTAQVPPAPRATGLPTAGATP
jgi:hypothetical protein